MRLTGSRPRTGARRRDGRRRIGPLALFGAWALHDVEEALAFPSTCAALAQRFGIPRLRIGLGQSWAAVGLMGMLVAIACLRGHLTRGRSRLYRAAVAGLEGHVATHLLALAARRGYTAGVGTALPVMLPGALVAKRELRREGVPLEAGDYVLGSAILVPAALACQVLARLLPEPGPLQQRVHRREM